MAEKGGIQKTECKEYILKNKGQKGVYKHF